MKCILGATVLSSLLSTAALANDVTDAVKANAKSADQWFTYTVDMAPGNGNPCCFTNYKSDVRVCSLDKRNNSWGNNHDDGDSQTLSLFFQWHDGQVDNLFITGDNCPVQSNGKTVTELSNISEKSSIEFLSDAIEARRGKHSRYVAAIALHQGQYAQQKLEQFTNSDIKKLRHKAIFWLGEARGKPGFDVLSEIVDDDRRPVKDRTKAIFGISQSKAEGAQDKLMRLAQANDNVKVQSKALFWLADTNHPKAAHVIEQVIDSDARIKVKEKAVFALTQLDGNQGWPTLVNLAKNARQPDVQEKAIFWLSQESKGDGKDATPILMEILQSSAPYSIKKKVVFALSQLPDEQATQALLDVIGSDQSKAIKKKALFWLGQSNDPRAMEAIENILAAN